MLVKLVLHAINSIKNKTFQIKNMYFFIIKSKSFEAGIAAAFFL
jgi:hypothetical protein